MFALDVSLVPRVLLWSAWRQVNPYFYQQVFKVRFPTWMSFDWVRLSIFKVGAFWSHSCPWLLPTSGVPVHLLILRNSAENSTALTEFSRSTAPRLSTVSGLKVMCYLQQNSMPSRSPPFLSVSWPSPPSGPSAVRSEECRISWTLSPGYVYCCLLCSCIQRMCLPTADCWRRAFSHSSCDFSLSWCVTTVIGVIPNVGSKKNANVRHVWNREFHLSGLNTY